MNNDEIDALREIVETMDVPQMRKQLRPEDIAWLRRNIAINNADHPDLAKALKLIAVASR